MELQQLWWRWCQTVGAAPQTIQSYRWESPSFWTVSLCVSCQCVQIYDDWTGVWADMHKHINNWGRTGLHTLPFRVDTVFMTLFIFFLSLFPPVHNWLENEPVLHDSWTDFLIKCHKIICSENKNADLPKFLYVRIVKCSKSNSQRTEKLLKPCLDSTVVKNKHIKQRGTAHMHPLKHKSVIHEWTKAQTQMSCIIWEDWEGGERKLQTS